uniref:AlNc14C28G2707 protein n=1 Tax=Albugo laibachii Nc14 TaxID=890382 RepID=F0W779_9STRA|nr:AlNc14C28G2707 [Albugo laibachii Nc14]|eukprot:CCA16978.1 AlNc14C28G2707 [Albugo laibachii Nc14]
MDLAQDAHKVPQKIEVRTLQGSLMDQMYVAQIWVLANAICIWIGSGDEQPRFSSMSTAVKTPYSPMPLVTAVVGNSELPEQQIAQRVAKSAKRQCFVSCQLPDIPELITHAERRIIEFLRDNEIIPRGMMDIAKKQVLMEEQEAMRTNK